jgi:hypothetical protein
VTSAFWNRTLARGSFHSGYVSFDIHPHTSNHPLRSHAVFVSVMPLQFELAKSYRRVIIDPIQPSLTVGAVTGTIPTVLLPDIYLISESEGVYIDETAIRTAKTNSLSGTSGLVAGGFAGVLISQHPALFSIAAGVQCFSLGSFFWCLYRLH